jgi:sterol desaturase/sphingolipid hydroxylase (fatty acid hydroxylase superfamily)
VFKDKYFLLTQFILHPLFYFGGVLETVDVLVTITIPAIIVYFIYPPVGIYILIFHYLYEVFFSEGVLDHNPAIKGRITAIFAWGDYHLSHHKNWNCNYGLLLTCWDHLFNTVKSPAKARKPKVYVNFKNTPVLQ